MNVACEQKPHPKGTEEPPDVRASFTASAMDRVSSSVGRRHTCSRGIADQWDHLELYGFWV